MRKARKIYTVFCHELSYMLRDKTTLIMMILLPIIVYPMMSVLSTYMVMTSAITVKKQATSVCVSRKVPELDKAISSHFSKAKISLAIKHLELTTDEVRAGINSGSVSVYIRVPERFEKVLSAEASAEIGLSYDGTNDKSMASIGEVQSALRDMRYDMVEERVEKYRINPVHVWPFDIAESNLATPAQIGDSFLSKVLPMLIIMFAALGSFYPAIDVTAMEKERGTLETLLLAPASIFDIMFGKFLAVFAITMLSVFINLASMGLTATHGYLLIKKFVAHKMVAAVSISVSPLALASIFVFMIPLACIMASIMMQVAIFARNFKEAQNYMTPILLFFMLPPMVSALPGYSLNAFTAMIPIVNLTLLFKGMLTGNYSAALLALTFAVNFAVSLVALYFAARTFASESVLFRPSEDIESLYFWRFERLGVSQEMTLVSVFFTVEMVLLYFGGSFLQTFFDLKTGLMLTEIVLILIPSALFVRSLYGGVLARIRFVIPKAADMAYSVAVAFSGFGFTAVITVLMSLLVSPPEDFMREVHKTVMANGVMEFFVISVVMAVLPALCEETMFRGAILPALVRKHGRIAGCAICGCLFGIFHLSAFRFVPTAVIGFYLSLLAVHTRSIIPAMICHFLNNFLIVAFTNMGGAVAKENAGLPEAALLAVALAAFIAFPFIIRRMLREDGVPDAADEKKVPAPEGTDAGIV